MSQADLARRIVKPADCVLGFAIPTSQRGFQFQRESRRDGSFAGSFHSWQQYWAQFGNAADKMLPKIRKLGARVQENLTLADLGRLFQEDSIVVLLTAHWREAAAGSAQGEDGAIEFADGFAAPSAILERIPTDARKIIDLTACRSTDLTIAIRRERVHCLTRSTPKFKVTPGLWIYFLYYLVKAFRERSITYLDAVSAIVQDLRRLRNDRPA